MALAQNVGAQIIMNINGFSVEAENRMDKKRDSILSIGDLEKLPVIDMPVNVEELFYYPNYHISNDIVENYILQADFMSLANPIAADGFSTIGLVMHDSERYIIIYGHYFLWTSVYIICVSNITRHIYPKGLILHYSSGDPISFKYHNGTIISRKMNINQSNISVVDNIYKLSPEFTKIFTETRYFKNDSEGHLFMKSEGFYTEGEYEFKEELIKETVVNENN